MLCLTNSSRKNVEVKNLGGELEQNMEFISIRDNIKDYYMSTAECYSKKIKLHQVARKSTGGKRPRHAFRKPHHATVEDPYICFYCELSCNSLDHVKRHLHGCHREERTLEYFRKSQPEKTFQLEKHQ